MTVRRLKPCPHCWVTEVETYCGLALSGQRSGRYPGLCVQAVSSGLCGQRLRARDESALEVAPPDRRLDRRPTAFTTMRYTNRQPLSFTFFSAGPEVVCVTSY